MESFDISEYHSIPQDQDRLYQKISIKVFIFRYIVVSVFVTVDGIERVLPSIFHHPLASPCCL